MLTVLDEAIISVYIYGGIMNVDDRGDKTEKGVLGIGVI